MLITCLWIAIYDISRGKLRSMERRGVSESDLRNGLNAMGADPAPPLDLFAIDLSSELSGAGELASTDSPFSHLPPADVRATDVPVKAADVGSAKPRGGASSSASATVAAAVVPVPGSAMPSIIVETPDEPSVTQAVLVRRRFYLTALPSWAISLGVHVGVLFLLAMLSMDPIRDAIGVALDAGGGNEGETLDDAELPGPAESVEAESSAEEFSASTSVVSEVVTMPAVMTTAVSTIAGINAMSMNNITESVLPSSMMGSGMSKMMTSLNGRGAGMKGEMLERFGGTANSEKSVAAAL